MAEQLEAGIRHYSLVGDDRIGMQAVFGSSMRPTNSHSHGKI